VVDSPPVKVHLKVGCTYGSVEIGDTAQCTQWYKRGSGSSDSTDSLPTTTLLIIIGSVVGVALFACICLTLLLFAFMCAFLLLGAVN
ncbi:MAG TPA: hypothetical protein VJB16_04355, partial [archaeon]|nr:hypothetical protein [archaeon]